jgi:hypothetical protein
MSWIDEVKNERIAGAGNHAIILSSEDNPTMVEIYDGAGKRIVVKNVSEAKAQKLIEVWNNLVDSGENPNKINLKWIFSD